MAENLEFKSPLGEAMLLHYQQCKTSMAKRSYVLRLSHLHDFDNYLVSIGYQSGDTIDEPIVTAWISTHKHLESSTIMTYTNSIRMFFRFCSHYMGCHFYEPPLYKVDNSYVPYILSDEDMTQVIELVDNYNYGAVCTLPYIKIEFPMVIRLLDSSGFRLGELISTIMKDVDLNNGVIKLTNTKKERERLIPLEESMTELIRSYCKVMKLHEYSDCCLFPRHEINEPLELGDIERRYEKVLIKAGIRTKSKKLHARGPCVHDLRHRFALRSIKQLLHKNVPFEEITNYLSTYLGHKSFNETEYYLKFFADIFPDELDKFAKYAAELLPDEDIWDDWM